MFGSSCIEVHGDSNHGKEWVLFSFFSFLDSIFQLIRLISFLNKKREIPFFLLIYSWNILRKIFVMKWINIVTAMIQCLNGYSFLICSSNNIADHALFLSLFRSSLLRLFSAYLNTHRYYVLSFILYFIFALYLLSIDYYVIN